MIVPQNYGYLNYRVAPAILTLDFEISLKTSSNFDTNV